MTPALTDYDPMALLVLVVSGDEAVRSSLALLLRVEGFAVSVLEAPAGPVPSPARVGCIVLDHPGRSSAQQAAQVVALARRHGDAETILLAGGPEEPPMQPTEGMRVLAVLRKPLLDDGIVRWVDRALARAALRVAQRP